MQIRKVERSQRGVENALVISLMLAVAQAALYITVSGFTLLGRWCSAETHVGLWYGVAVALTFGLVWGFLPAAVLTQGYVQVVRVLPICHLALYRIVATGADVDRASLHMLLLQCNVRT